MASAQLPKRHEVVYPEQDGNPMSDNTLQFRWIVTIQGGLDAMFRDRPDVFVAGDLLWYPVEGDNRTRIAPDAMVAFGRPKGDRGSYRQWDEGGVAPQVVFEVLSPGNRPGEMAEKLKFYDRFGVEEYYKYDPDNVTLQGYVRRDGRLEPVAEVDGWVSPRLGLRFDMSGDELRLFEPDGSPLLTYLEQAQLREEAERRRVEAERQRDDERRRVERLEARLRALGESVD